MNTDDYLNEDAFSREQALSRDSFIVEAPAGAGKTELLTQRFLTLLQEVNAPEEIIAITFTNKAASEMRLRIMQSLVMASEGIAPAQAHKQATFSLGQAVLARSEALGWHILNAPARLRIYTIDALSANLARQMPILSRFGTQPRIQDDASLYFQQAAEQTLEMIEHPSVGPLVQQALRYFDNDFFKLSQLMAAMLAKRDQWLPYTQSPQADAVAQAALAQMIGTDMQMAAQVLTPNEQQRLMPVARFAASQLPCDAPIALLQDWDSPLPADAASLSMWRAATDLLLTQDGRFRSQLTKTIGLPATDDAKPHKEALKALIEALQLVPEADIRLARIRKLPSASQDASQWQMVATLAKLLQIAVGQLWLVFQAHGEVDFVEVARRGLEALQDHEGHVTDLALQLDYRIQHILVDEFQDTSPTQIKLIRALTHGWQANDGRTLFCVGDPMQSIYRFRKANVGLFLQVAQHGIGHIRLKPLKLWRNNRSTPPIIDWVNQAFARIFPSHDSISQGAISYRPFVATQENVPHSVVKFHAFVHHDTQTDTQDDTEEATDQPQSTSDVRQQEADRIIAIIQNTWAERPEASIAVLVRARNHLEALVSEIRRHHPTLAFQAVEIEALANRQIVQDLLSLTHALHQRADRLHWLAVLRAPWCGLTLADLHALVAHDKHSTILDLMQQPTRLQTLSADGRQRLQHVHAILHQALQHQGRTSTSRWLRGTWLALGGARCLWAPGDVHDVEAFFARVHSLEVAGQFSPEQLALAVQKLYAAPDTTASQLQLMTIHKSKGLQFDTVILPGLDRKTGNNAQALMLWEEVAIEHSKQPNRDVSLVVAPFVPMQRKSAHVTAYDYLNMLENERAELEDARVLYVAATRAERCLHLLGAAKRKAKTGELGPPKQTFLAMLWPLVAHEFTEQLIARAVARPNHQNQSLADFVPQLIRLQQLNPVEAMVTQRQSQRANPSELPPPAVSDALEALVGTLTHNYLQRIAEQGLDFWPLTRVKSVQPAMQRWLIQQGQPPQAAESATQQVVDMLHTMLSQTTGRWVLQAHAHGACELAIETANTDGVDKKVIDRSFVEREIRWIIDYKTTAQAIGADTMTLAKLAEPYRAQLASYAERFAYEGRAIRLAVLFVRVGQLVEL